VPRLTNNAYEAFARHYVANGFHASKAAAACGYVPAHGAQLMERHPEIADRIRELTEMNLQHADITAQRVMLELGRVAFADIRGLYAEDGTMRPVHELDDDTAATVAAIETEETQIVNKGARVPMLDLVTGEQLRDEAGELRFESAMTQVRVRKVKRYDKAASLVTLAKHFKLIGDEGDGVNALASALADRLDAARRRTRPPEEPTP
jgi:phage terminase small subunit